MIKLQHGWKLERGRTVFLFRFLFLSLFISLYLSIKFFSLHVFCLFLYLFSSFFLSVFFSFFVWERERVNSWYELIKILIVGDLIRIISPKRGFKMLVALLRMYSCFLRNLRYSHWLNHVRSLSHLRGALFLSRCGNKRFWLIIL